MFIQGIKKRGHTYYAVYHGKRLINKVIRETKLYIGRLDNMDEARRAQIEQKLSELDPALIQKFLSILLSLGYRLPSPVSMFSVEEVYEYGPVLALHKVCEEIGLASVVDNFGLKGGGPDLGKLVEIMAIARNCDPCSCFQIPEWYSRSILPFLLKLPPSELTYWVVIRALDYLQPERTIPMQIALYKNIRRVYGYECERLDIDITSTYFEGNECIVAEFGHSRDHRPDRPQIVVAFVVDQKGVLVTQRVWPGNRSDAKILKPMDRCLRKEFGLDAPNVVDRGMASWENLDYMDRKKERYLVALRAEIKGTKLLEEISVPRDQWIDVGDGEVAYSVIKGRRKYVVVWNASVAETNRKERESRVSRAEGELRLLLDAVEKGKIKSRRQRDERIGYILRKHRVRRYLKAKGKREGFGFTVERKKAIEDARQYDGYQIFVTTELDLSEREVVEAYRIRDQVEKAIRTLKNVLALHPIYVRTKEHVIGHIFICALAYQLRSILRMKLKERGMDMSVEEAIKTLERLKAVHIAVHEGKEIRVYRKLSSMDRKTRTLIEVFNMAEDGKLPEVEMER